MESIKRGTTPTISAHVEGVEIDDIEKIEFIFKHIVSSRAAAICTKFYPGGGVSYDAQSTTFDIALTEAETRKFCAASTAYMDTRITLNGGVIPQTDIVQFSVFETLFPEVVNA